MPFRTEDVLKQELAALPELAPPPEAKARVLTAMRRAAAERPVRRWRTPVLAAMALAATAAFAAMLLLWQPSAELGERRFASDEISDIAPMTFEDYAALVAQSAELERALVTLPAPRSVMRASTAGTIASLEERLALIDHELTLATAAGLESRKQAALWQDRVDVMNALVQVRYANSQAFIY